MAIDMKEKKEEKKEQKKIKKEIPNEVKIAFGKFYSYSFVLILLNIVILFLMSKLKLWFMITYLVIALGFYCYMLFNLFMKKNRFMSTLVVLDILVFVLVYSLILLKIIGLS